MRSHFFSYKNIFNVFSIVFILALYSIPSTPLHATEKNNFKGVGYSSITNSLRQVFTIPSDSSSISHTLTDCYGDNQFIDDSPTSLYRDDSPRRDTITFCPQNNWQIVKVSFLEFDVAPGDALEVYEGDLKQVKNNTAPLIGSASGGSPSAAFGAWVQANCDPRMNKTGCLTFHFKTNGDLNKGTGWKGQVSCKDRNIQLKKPTIFSTVECGTYSDQITIPGVEVSADCGTINDDVLVEVYGRNGVCINQIISKSRNITANQTFAIGVYSIRYTLLSDSTKTVSTVFSVGDPSIVCNNQINISLGSGCSTTLVPDMILENTCDPIPGVMHYEIVVKNARGSIIAQGGKNGDYPQIDHTLIDACKGELYTAEISVVYFEDLPLSYCNKGVQKETCHTQLLFQDITAPNFDIGLSSDIIYNCDIELTESGLAPYRPIVIDNCSKATATFHGASDISVPGSCDKKYTITWLTEDACGNQAYLDRTLIIKRPGLDKIVKTKDTFLSCGEDAPEDIDNFTKAGILGLKVGYERNGNFYVTDTLALSTTDYVCNYILTKTDQGFPSNCGSKTFRFWNLLDWCNGAAGVIPIDTQLIKFIDTLAPTIQCTPHASLAMAEYINIPGYQCSMTPNFPLPLAFDKCDPDVAVQMFTVETIGNNGHWNKIGSNLSHAGPLECGTYRTGWRAFDSCLEQIKEDTCYRYFILQDKTAPSAVCKDQLNVSIGTHQANIKTTSIDGGSSDACGISQMLVRRTECGDMTTWSGTTNEYISTTFGYNLDPTGWQEEVPLECCDIDQYVKIELLVLDHKGNYNSCEVNILVEDKLSPICSSLPSQTDYCDEVHATDLGNSTDINNNGLFDYNEWVDLENAVLDFYNTSYGDPLTNCSDNLTCNDLSIEQQYQLIDAGCGQLQIKRRFRAIDQQGNVSSWGEQIITINYRPNWSITFPIDWIGYCGNTVPDTDIAIEKGQCDNLAYEVRDQIFKTPSGACFKVLRTFTIINWCRFDPDAPVYEVNRIISNTGKVTIPQTITSDDWGNYSKMSYIQILEVRDRDAPIISIAEVADCIIGNSCEDTKNFSITATDCNENAAEYLSYHWEILAYNKSIGNGTGSSFNWEVKADIPYTINWTVSDQCGNAAIEQPTYLFKDCKAPTPYCISGLAISLMETSAEVAIWASDFNLGSFDNCTETAALDIRMYHPTIGEQPTTLLEIQQLPKSITFDCSSVGTQLVDVYVIDQNGNYDYCSATIVIQDNHTICNHGQVTGSIKMKDGLAVEGTDVYIEGFGAMPAPYTTNTDGGYHFDLDMGGDYTIRPEKNIHPLNGVSTLDLVFLTKHILGIESFESPYQFIAGDVNKSSSITAYDIVLTRRMILGISKEFPNNKSWRFVPADYTFTSTNPFTEAFPESIVINNLPGTIDNVNFIAIKVGDVSGSALGNKLAATANRSNQEPFTLEVEDQEINKGEQIIVPVYATNIQDIEGYQFTLSFKDLAFDSLEDGLITSDHFGTTQTDQGYLVTSWNSYFTTVAEIQNSPLSDINKTLLFQLIFTAQKDGLLSDLIAINSDIANAEAYHKNGDALDVILKTSSITEDKSLHFFVEQNKPNPFKETTTFSFQLPKASTISLKVLDIQGHLIYENTRYFEKGNHTIPFYQDLPAGTYVYQIASLFGQETKKMIVLK